MSIATPMKKKSAPRRRRWGARRSAPRRGARVALPKRITGNFASRMEQFSVQCTAGLVYDFTFNLHDLVSTNQLATLYQYYRITSVEMRFKPVYDTFVAQGNNGATALPYLYFQYDKSGTLNGTMNANNFEQIGTKAIRLDDKTIVRKWKPSVIISNPTPDTALGLSQFKVSPWLPTQISGNLNDKVTHYGSVFYISKTTASDSTNYDVDVVVNVQYRKPAVVTSSPTQSHNPPRVIQGDTTHPTGILAPA